MLRWPSGWSPRLSRAKPAGAGSSRQTFIRADPSLSAPIRVLFRLPGRSPPARTYQQAAQAPRTGASLL